MLYAMVVVLLASFLATPALAGHTQIHRSQQCASRGEVRMALSLAGEIANYAMERYELDTLIGGHALDRVPNQLYGYLRWKFGGPTAICNQYITHGLEPLREGFAEEAVVALLGVDLPNDAGQAHMVLPEWVVQYLQRAGTRVTALLTASGLPAPVATAIAEQVKGLSGKAPRPIRLAIPQTWDLDSRFVETMLAAYKVQFPSATPEVRSTAARPALPTATGTNPPSPWSGSMAAPGMAPAGALWSAAPSPGTPDDRLAELEARVAALEARLDQGGRDALPVALQGYESVHLDANASGDNRLRVAVNGRHMAEYDARVEARLDPFLKPGVVNAVTMTFERATTGTYLNVLAKSPGSPLWTEVLKFSPAKNRLGKDLELPFVGTKTR